MKITFMNVVNGILFAVFLRPSFVNFGIVMDVLALLLVGLIYSRLRSNKWFLALYGLMVIIKGKVWRKELLEDFWKFYQRSNWMA